MKKRYSFLLEENTISRIDAHLEEPISRSEVLDAVLQNVLDDPNYIKSFVQQAKAQLGLKLQALQITQ